MVTIVFESGSLFKSILIYPSLAFLLFSREVAGVLSHEGPTLHERRQRRIMLPKFNRIQRVFRVEWRMPRSGMIEISPWRRALRGAGCRKNLLLPKIRIWTKCAGVKHREMLHRPERRTEPNVPDGGPGENGSGLSGMIPFPPMSAYAPPRAGDSGCPPEESPPGVAGRSQSCSSSSTISPVATRRSCPA